MKKTIGGKLLICFVLTAVVSLLAVAGAMAAADTAIFNTASSGDGIVYRGSNPSNVAYCLNYTMDRPQGEDYERRASLSSGGGFYGYLGRFVQGRID